MSLSWRKTSSGSYFSWRDRPAAAALRTAQLSDPEALQDLKAADEGVVWLIPSVFQLLPDLERFDTEGLGLNSLLRPLRSASVPASWLPIGGPARTF